MHQITRGTGPCGLEDGHRGRHRTMAGAAREARRRQSQGYLDTVRRWKNDHPAAAYLASLRHYRRQRAVGA